MRTILFNGPFIPEVDAGYNVQANGVSINFLKDPFCFRHNIINENDKNNSLNKPVNFIDEHMKILNPLTTTKLVEVPRYIYEEHIINKNDIIHKNVYVPYVGPVYKIKEVKVPVYKEKIRYIPKIIEKEKIYEIPKIEIKNKIQEKIVYLHRNNIKYKKLNHVVERIIPMLKTKVTEKTVELSNTQILKFSNNDKATEIQPSIDLVTDEEICELDLQENTCEKNKIEQIMQEYILQNNEEVEEINENFEIKYAENVEAKEVKESKVIHEIEESKKDERTKEIEVDELNSSTCPLQLKLSLSYDIKKKQQLGTDVSPQKGYLKFSEELNLSNISSGNTEESLNLYSSEDTN